jgi:hypothetical protein
MHISPSGRRSPRFDFAKRLGRRDSGNHKAATNNTYKTSAIHMPFPYLFLGEIASSQIAAMNRL